MLPVIELFGVRIYTYYLCAILAGMTGYVLCVRGFRKKGIGKVRWILPIAMILCALLGARLLNVCLNPTAYKKDFSPWTISYKNLSLMGGLILGVFPVILYGVIRKKDIAYLLGIMDTLVLPAGVGIMILKLGCFLNGCCFGKHTDSIFGMVFPANASHFAVLRLMGLIEEGMDRVHPTQLYEIAGTFFSLLIVYLFRKKGKDGGKFGLFTALFSSVRLAVLPMRSFMYAEKILKFWYPIGYGLVILAGAGLFFYSCFERKKYRCFTDL